MLVALQAVSLAAAKVAAMAAKSVRVMAAPWDWWALMTVGWKVWMKARQWDT